MSLLHVDGSLNDGLSLHLGDLGIGDSQTAATVAHHGVELMQRGDNGLDVLHSLALSLGQQLDVLFLSRNELVQRGIQEADVDVAAAEGLIQLLKVALLHGLQLGQSGLALLHSVRADHLADGSDTVGIEEHVLGTAQADALRAEGHSLLGVTGSVGVGADLQLTVLVRELHDAAEIAALGGSGHSGDGLTVDVAGGAVQGDIVALMVLAAGQGELLVLLIHLDVAAARDTAGAHAAGHNGRVAGHAAAHGQDALGVLHALDVLGRGLQADQDHLFTGGTLLHSVLSGEDDLAAGGAGGSSQSAGHGSGSLQGFRIELGMEQSVQLLGIQHQQGFLLGLHALVDQVAGNLDGGSGGALAVTGLQHVELAVLHGELHILHIVIVALQQVADFLELLEGLGELLSHLGDGHGGADTGHHVLALGVGQKLAEELLLAGGGAAGKGHAGAAVIAHVAEGHHLHVDSGAPGIGDLVHAAVHVGAGVVPRAEHGLDGAHQLLLGVGGEVSADLLLVLGLELLGQFLQVVSGELGVHGDAALFLHLVDKLLEVLLAHFHNHVGVHLDESPVAVISPAGIAGLLGHDLHDVLVEAQVQDGVHHAGHGSAGARADRDQQGVLLIAELLAGDLLHLTHILHDLGLDLIVDLTAILIVLGAGFRADGKALGDRQAELGHFRQVRALAAKKLTHGTVAFAEQIDILVAHW